MVRFPTERTTVIVLANREDLDVSSTAFGLADEALGDRLDEAAPHADHTFDGVSTDARPDPASDPAGPLKTPGVARVSGLLRGGSPANPTPGEVPV